MAKFIWQLLPGPRPKRTSKTDAMADEYARKMFEDYFCADFAGYSKRYLLYYARFGDTIVRCLGMSSWILIRNGVVRHTVGSPFCNAKEVLIERAYEKGMDTAKRWRKGIFLNDEERANAEAIKLYIKNVERINLKTIFNFIELADRLKMNIKCTHKYSLWYLELY